MIETPERVIRFLRRLDASNYLDVKFAFMPASQWQKVIKALPESVLLIARVWLLPDGILEEFVASGDIRLRDWLRCALAFPRMSRRYWFATLPQRCGSASHAAEGRCEAY